MAKAGKALPLSACPLNRRCLLSGASFAAVAIAAPAVAQTTSQASTNLAVPPTKLGREYLSTMAALRSAWAGHDGSDEHPHIDDLQRQLGTLEERILARPVCSAADVVDLALVAGYCAFNGFDATDPAEALANGILRLAGLPRSECIV